MPAGGAPINRGSHAGEAAALLYALLTDRPRASVAAGGTRVYSVHTASHLSGKTRELPAVATLPVDPTGRMCPVSRGFVCAPSLLRPFRARYPAPTRAGLPTSPGHGPP